MKTGGRRLVPGKALAAALAAGGLLVASAGMASGVAVPTGSSGSWSGYATGSPVHVHALQVAAQGPRVADTDEAFSAASFSSDGLGTALNNEMNEAVHPAKAGKDSYGRGSGLEVGVGTSVPNNPDAHDLIVGGLAEAAAQPPEPGDGAPNAYQTDLVTKDLVSVPGDPAVYANTLRGQAQALWNNRYVLPMLGNPLALGHGYAADAQLLDAGTPNRDGSFSAPVLATDTTNPDRAASSSTSYSYLVNNGDGTCGVASEVHETIAPVRLNLPPDTDATNDTTVEFLGEWVLKVVATGKPGGGHLTYAPPGKATPSTPIVRIIDSSGVNQLLSFQDLFGDSGFVTPTELNQILSLAVGEDPRAISAPGADPDASSKPTVTDTEVSGAVDVVRLGLLHPDSPNNGVQGVDLRFGHMEAKVKVPAGGINCEIPVSKTVTPNPASVGGNLTFTVNVPTDKDALIPFPCKLTHIRLVDVVGVEHADNPAKPPQLVLTGGTAPNGSKGVVSGNTITFDDIGTYTPGDPPIVVTIEGTIPKTSGTGKLKDTVTATGTPSDCKASNSVVGGLIGGNAFFGSTASGLTGAITGGGTAKLTGDFTLNGPGIARVLATPEQLPKTGGAPWALAGLAALLGAAGIGVLARRAART
jgi:hypothetical protein